MADKRINIIDDELLIVRHSGEIPEIILCASLYYLQDDSEGPGLVIDEDELRYLQDEGLARSREIILRDLDPDNRDLGLYRGVKRSIANYRRHHNFLVRLGRKDEDIRAVTAQAFLDFVCRELEDNQSGLRASSLNCTLVELLDFMDTLKISPTLLPAGWEKLCQNDAGLGMS